MATSSLCWMLAAAFLLAPPAAAQAQHAGHMASPPSTAQLNARAASDAAQALDTAAAPGWQPAPLLGPDGKPLKSGSNTTGLYDNKSQLRVQEKGTFDPNAIHYPYGRYSLGTVDPTSAANPYSPYGSLPNTSYRDPLAPQGPGTPAQASTNGAPSTTATGR